MNKEKKLIVGSRNSRMALAQTNEFISVFLEANHSFKAENIEIKPIATSGDINQKDRLDLIGGKGLFVKEIERKLLNKEIDVAVHSMKDVPTVMTPGLKIASWLARGDERGHGQSKGQGRSDGSPYPVLSWVSSGDHHGLDFRGAQWRFGIRAQFAASVGADALFSGTSAHAV